MIETIKVLDHGYVKLCECWGNGGNETTPDDMESGIIMAARQSTQGSFRGWEEDQKLLRYLYMNDPQHSTPFEFAGMIVELEAPFFVVREMQRHRTASITDDCFSGDIGFNEMSARYTPIPCKDFVPTKERCLLFDPKNKQSIGLDGKELDEYNALVWIENLKHLQEHAEKVYQEGLELGIPKELARGALTVNRYSRMRVTAYLRNWCAFVLLRSHPKAQIEIQEYSRAIEKIISSKFPKVYSHFLQRRDG